jgi:LPXTG-motif cell wall-anchored protein
VYRFPSGGAAFGGGVGGLAATGIDPSWWIIGGLLSVVVGVFLVRSARRAGVSRHRKN